MLYCCKQDIMFLLLVKNRDLISWTWLPFSKNQAQKQVFLQIYLMI